MVTWQRLSFLAACLLLSLPSSLYAEPDSADRLDEVNAEIKSLGDTVAANQKQRDALYRQLKKQSKAVSKLNRHLRQLTETLKEKNQALAVLEKKQNAFRRSKATQLKALNSQVRSAYLQTQPHYLKVLLNQQDPAMLSRANTYFHYFNQARQSHLTDISSSLQGLESHKQALLVARQEQELLVAEQQQEQSKLQAKKAQQLATAKQLDNKLSNDTARIASLKTEATALRDLLSSLSSQQRALAPSTPFAKLKGKLLRPSSGRVTSRFGSSRQLGNLTWQGVMIKSPVGNEIISAAAGRVVFSDWLRGFGLLLIIDHGDKYMTLYGNNQSLLKEVGESVNAGELIALSGNQGIKQYAGLYFELRHKGNPTDPLKWLKKRS